MNNYWRWLFFGTNDTHQHKPGILRIFDKWILLHFVIGYFLYDSVKGQFNDIAKTVVLPLASALIGMTFAWAGNLNSILNSQEISELSKFKDGGFEEYVYIFQTSILLVLTSVSLWACAAIGLFSSDFSKFLLFTLLCATIRESWHFVLGVHYLLISKNNIKETLNARSKIKNNKEFD